MKLLRKFLILTLTLQGAAQLSANTREVPGNNEYEMSEEPVIYSSGGAASGPIIYSSGGSASNPIIYSSGGSASNPIIYSSGGSASSPIENE